MISNCGHDENGKYSGGQAGDQTGTEWQMISWFSRPWTEAYAPPSEAIGADLAKIATNTANNDKVGYDQDQRTTFYTQLMNASNYDPANITQTCEADCSAGVAALVAACGKRMGNAKMAAISKKCYTGNLGAALVNCGFVKHTESKYLTSDKYLGKGWVLLYPGHHTAINCSNGSCYSSSSSSTSSSTSSDIDQLAQDVIAGKYGNADARKAALGDKYAAVQKRVNELLGVSGSSSSSSSGYSTGEYVTIVDCLNVRTGAGTNYARKSKSQLTSDGQKHSNSKGQLNEGTYVTVQQVQKSGSNWWGKIPSGWICLEWQGEAYVKKV